MDLTRSASFVFDPGSLVEGTHGPLVASFLARRPPPAPGQKSEFSKGHRNLNQIFRSLNLLAEICFGLNVRPGGVTNICKLPGFPDRASISPKNREFQAIAPEVVGEVVVGISTIAV